MVGYNMNGPTRDQVMKLMEEKGRIERELAEMHLVLENNHVSMNDSLLDAEGYPRNDIDVYQVRHARHRIICLKNDHKEMMKLIERGLHTLHADFLRSRSEGPSHISSGQSMEHSPAQSNGIGHLRTNGHTTVNGHMEMNGHAENGHDVDMVVEATRDLGMADQAFLKVNLVSPGSPADAAGIQVDDEILQFGSINARNFSSLAQVAELVRHAAGTRLDVRLTRDARAMHVALVPGAWAGRGLLGCNIVPL